LCDIAAVVLTSRFKLLSFFTLIMLLSATNYDNLYSQYSGSIITKKLSYRRGKAWRIILVNSAMFHKVWELETFQTEKVTFLFIQKHRQLCHSIGHIRFHISVSLHLRLYVAPFSIYYDIFPKNIRTSRDSEHIPFGSDISCMH